MFAFRIWTSKKNKGSEAQRLKKLTQSSFEICAINFFFIKVVTLPLNDLFLFCWSTLGALVTESKDIFCDCDDVVDLVLGWGGGGGGGREFCFLQADEEREEEESSLLLGLMKEEEKETSIFSGVMAREEGRQSDILYWEMVSDHLWAAKIHSHPHHPKTAGDQA